MPKTTSASAPAAYVAASPIEHDGMLYAIGDALPITPEQAQPLIACGAVLPAAESGAPGAAAATEPES